MSSPFKLIQNDDPQRGALIGALDMYGRELRVGDVVLPMTAKPVPFLITNAAPVLAMDVEPGTTRVDLQAHMPVFVGPRQRMLSVVRVLTAAEAGEPNSPSPGSSLISEN